MEQDLTIQLVSQLSELNANMKTVLTRLEAHEDRLLKLESAPKQGLRGDVVALLVKAVVIAVITIASISGAGGLLKGIFGL